MSQQIDVTAAGVIAVDVAANGCHVDATAKDVTAKRSQGKEVSQQTSLTANRSHSKEVTQQRNLTAKRSHSKEI